MNTFRIVSRFGHYEVIDLSGKTIVTGDTYNEAAEELELMENK